MRSSHHLLTLKEQKMRDLQASLHSEVGGGRRGGGRRGEEEERTGGEDEGGMGRRGGERDRAFRFDSPDYTP